jgi:cell division protein ZapA
MSDVKPVTVKILSKEFQVNCPIEAEEQLLDAALYLDRKMRDIRSNGRVIGLEKMAIMAALNIAHELLSHRQQKEEYVQTVSEQIERLQNKLDEALMGNTATENAIE